MDRWRRFGAKHVEFHAQIEERGPDHCRRFQFYSRSAAQLSGRSFARWLLAGDSEQRFANLRRRRLWKPGWRGRRTGRGARHAIFGESDCSAARRGIFKEWLSIWEQFPGMTIDVDFEYGRRFPIEFTCTW